MLAIETQDVLSPDVKAFWHLLKPRVMSLVIFTALCGFLLAPGTLHPFLSFCSILAIALGSGAAGCLNMWYESDRDALMSRTKDRPIPVGLVEKNASLIFGLVLAFLSIILLDLASNHVAAGLLAFTIAFYVIIYTIFLKPRTPSNIVIGGLSGALPPVIAWYSVSPEFHPIPWFLCLIVFLWTPAHFWSLSLVTMDDYKKANFPMLPLIKGVKVTSEQIMYYATFTVLASFLPLSIHFNTFYAFGAAFLGVCFLITSYRLVITQSAKIALQNFSCSIFYLFFLFLLMLVYKGQF